MTETLIYSLRPLTAVCVSLIAALLIMYFGKHPKFREGITLLAASVKVLIIFSMIPDTIHGKIFEWSGFEVVDGVSFSLKADPLGMVFACVASALWLVVSVYSIGYMNESKEENQTGFYASFAVCLSATIGICFASNLVTFFVFFEMLTVATYPLVVHHRDEESKMAGRKYLAYTLVGGQLFLVGIVLLYNFAGTTDFVPGGFVKDTMAGKTFLIVTFFLLVIAGLIKAGMMPLHSWLPSAMVAPTPVSSLLHAVAVVKAGAFCVLRIICYVYGPELCKQLGVTTVLAVLASITIILASLIARKQDHLKRRLAFSTVSQLSYIILGVCILAPISIIGAIFHIVAHAFLKITLFMCAGAITVTEQKTNVSQLDGIGYRMPVTILSYAVCALGICGMPFTVGFVSKLNIIVGAALEGKYIYIAVLVISALLSASYLMPVPIVAFRKKQTPDRAEQGYLNIKSNKVKSEYTYHEANKLMLAPLVFTAVTAIVLGVFPNMGAHLFTLAQMAAESITGGVAGAGM